MNEITKKEKKNVLKKSAAERAEDRRLVDIWNDAMMTASTLNGHLRITWVPLHSLHDSLYTYENLFHHHLVTIRLIGVELKHLPDNFGDSFPLLQQLVLENNKLVALPDSITKLTHLSELMLANNILESLPDRIGYLCALKSLSINNNKLQALPLTFGALNMLERVDLECNQIKVLPENLDHLLSCRSLNINNNELIRLPRCLARMPSLTTLSATNNHITYLPSEIFNSHSIKCLRLGRNQITLLPDRIGNLSQLEELVLDYNRLQRLPLSFYRLINLKILRIEGNNDITDPPSEVILQGTSTIINYFRDLYLYDKQARMRHIILSTQNILHQITEHKLYDLAYFEPDIELRNSTNSTDLWYGMQLVHLFRDLLPKLHQMWSYYRSRNLPIPSLHDSATDAFDNISEFLFNEKEVIWAFTNFQDADGPVMQYNQAMFRRCACIDPQTGQRKVCVPPKIGYMCLRDCYLIKKSILRVRDKEDRRWELYKTNSLQDAVQRAEKEAIDYLKTNAGQDWLNETAYEQSEELLMDVSANKVVERRLANLEKNKQKIIKKYDVKINRINKIRNKKSDIVTSELNRLKENRKLAREGYLRNAIEQKIDEVTKQLANLPENIEIQKLQLLCEMECEKLEDEVYLSTSDSKEDELNPFLDEELEGSDEYSENDHSEDAERWRKKRRQLEQLRESETKLEFIKRRFPPVVIDSLEEDKAKKRRHKLGGLAVLDTNDKNTNEDNDGDDEKEDKKEEDEDEIIFNPIETMNKTIETFQDKVYYPMIEPRLEKMDKKIKRFKKKTNRFFRDIKDVSRMRIRRLYLKVNGQFDEITRELKDEIYRQYVEHHIQEAKDKARKEFHVIERVRQNFKGFSREKAFIAWKRWVWTKQKRIRRDLRKQYKTSMKAYQAGMESVRSAQIQVDMWKPEFDIYTDQPFWQHAITGAVTFDEPTVHYYLPSNFIIPTKPEELPPEIPMDTSSSSDDSLGEWQRKHGQRRGTADRPKRRKTATPKSIKPAPLLEDDLEISSDTDESQGNFEDKNEHNSQPISPNPTNLLLTSGSQRPRGVSGGATTLPAITNTPNRSQSQNQAVVPWVPSSQYTLEEFFASDYQDSLPMIMESARPTDLQDVQEYIKPKTNNEYEIAFKAIRKKRNQLNPNRHQTYMSHMNRKPRSFQQIQEESNKKVMIEIDDGIFVEEGKIDFVNPTDEELLKLAGGTIDMMHMGKNAVELRSIIAQRAIHLKKKLYEKAVKRGLAPPITTTFYEREIKPIFGNYEEPSSDEDEETKKKRIIAEKKERRAQRQTERAERRAMVAKMENVVSESVKAVGNRLSIKTP